MSVTMNRIMPGSSGVDICFARRLLAIFNVCDLAEEDFFDSDTVEHVKSFQKKCGLSTVGEIDLQTWRRLAPSLSKEYSYWNREKAVKLIQIYLRKLGYIYFIPDGIYGTGTQAAVEAFQLTNGLKVDGIWGKSCWNIWFFEGCLKKSNF